jgi:tripartite-type tricarboxylate transporter receptor subunit TctC
MKKNDVVLISVFVLGFIAVQSASAQEFSGTVRIIVPYAAGGTSDIISRLVAPDLQKALKTNVIVENKPGANGNIGADAVAHAKKDGHTLLFCDLGALVASPALYGKKLTFSLEKDLAPVHLTMFAPYILAVHPSVPVKTTDELVKYAKANPGKLAQGMSGIGNANHLTGIQLTKLWGVNWKFVAYKGGADAIRGVVSNESQIIVNGATATQSFVVQNQLTGLSVSGATRLAALPNLPTWKELKLPVADNGTWQGFLTTAGTPKQTIERLNSEIAKILAMPEIKKKIEDLGGEIKGGSIAVFEDWMKTNTAEFSKVVAEAGIKLE